MEQTTQNITSGGPGQAFVTPSANDVLCGRGRISFQHEGNRKFRFLIASHLSEYTQARTKKQKIDLVRSIAQTIRDRGGRFLKQDRETQLWYDAGIQAARKKVGHSLRDASNDKIKCVRAMSKSLEKKNALNEELKKNAEKAFALEAKPDFSSSLPFTTMFDSQQGGPLWLPAPVSSSANAISMNTSPLFGTVETISCNESVESESTLSSALEYETMSNHDADELAVDPLSMVHLDSSSSHGSKATSVSSEVLSIFNEINLCDLEEYCDRQEQAMKLSSSSRLPRSDTLVRT